MTSVASVKDRLRNQAKKINRPLQEIYTAYGLERALYRLSISEYADKFVLKGGILLYALFGSDFPRVTRDIDFLAQRISNEADSMKQVFQKVFSIEVDDALRFDVENITVENITEFKEYHGLNVSTIAYLDRTRIPVSIDIGFGDIVYPEKVKMDFPALLNMDSPVLYAYSRESIIAEKYEAIIQLGYGNGRLKDFYDIYLLSKSFDFDGEILKEAVRETFEHRKTFPNDSNLYEYDFINDPLLSSRWETFKKQKQAFDTLSFKETIIFIRNFMFPIIRSINENSSFYQRWNHIDLSWE
jgi:predicted nucleotidyltransferase component of viral defense system